MNTRFASILNEGKDVLVPEAVNRLRNSPADHYRNTDVSCLFSNCHRLIHAFSLALGEERDGFTEYVRKIGKDRIKEGFDLTEMQYALNTIEELVWRVCVEKVADEEEKLKDLHLIASLIGSAKDGLARQYLEASQDAVAAATPIWKKMQDAEAITLRKLEEGFSKGTGGKVKQ